MRDFIAVDFETANPKRVSACSMGVAKVVNSKVVENRQYLIKPIGGHAEFQTKIHGLSELDTNNKPDFGQLFCQISDIFSVPLVGHSLFDRQVINALNLHFDLDINYDYLDTCSIAKEALPSLKNHKLKTLAKHFSITMQKSHDAMEDAMVCARIYLELTKLQNYRPVEEESLDFEFKGIATGILFDEEVSYKEVYGLLYWLDDHPDQAKKHYNLYHLLHESLNDNKIDKIEEKTIKFQLSMIVDG